MIFQRFEMRLHIASMRLYTNFFTRVRRFCADTFALTFGLFLLIVAVPGEREKHLHADRHRQELSSFPRCGFLHQSAPHILIHGTSITSHAFHFFKFLRTFFIFRHFQCPWSQQDGRHLGLRAEPRFEAFRLQCLEAERGRAAIASGGSHEMAA